MRWEDERYVRLYTRETVDDLCLGWEARSLWKELLTRFDRAGLIDLGKHGAKGLAVLVHWPAEVVERALPELLKDGRCELSGSVLIAPNFVAAQSAVMSPKLRNSEWRMRERDFARAKQALRDRTSHLANETLDEQDATSPKRDATRRAETTNQDKTILTEKRREGVNGASAPAPILKAFELQNLWNEQANKCLPRWNGMSDVRKRAAQKALKLYPLEQWPIILERLNASTFCAGQNDRFWVASPDWILKPDNIQKLIEGKYDNRSDAKRPDADQGIIRSGH